MTQDDFAAMRAGAADFKKQVCDLEFAGLKMMGVPVATARHAVNYFERLAERLERATGALTRAGFEDLGGQEWKPPLGKPPRFIEVEKVEQTGCAQRANECGEKAAAPSVPSGEKVHEIEFLAAELLPDTRVFTVASVARQVQAAREQALEDAATRMEERRAKISPVELCGEEVWETANNVISNLVAAVRALKSAAPQAPQPKQAAWVSVDERLPGTAGPCLVFSTWGVRLAYRHEPQWANGCFQDALSKSDEGTTDFDGYCKGVFRVTHWRDLPAAPQAAATDKPAQQEKQQ